MYCYLWTYMDLRLLKKRLTAVLFGAIRFRLKTSRGRVHKKRSNSTDWTVIYWAKQCYFSSLIVLRKVLLIKKPKFCDSMLSWLTWKNLDFDLRGNYGGQDLRSKVQDKLTLYIIVGNLVWDLIRGQCPPPLQFFVRTHMKVMQMVKKALDNSFMAIIHQ